ncbi:MAG: CinA family protein [Acidimicrobiales bacterium]
MASSNDRIDTLAATVAADLAHRGSSVAVAESLTGGLLANALARADGASKWFRGGVVAYAADVKHALLGVPDVAVVSRIAAEAMARQAAALLGSPIGLAVTGVGGPEPQDGVEVGTVWVAAFADHESHAWEHRFPGDPAEICSATCAAALSRLHEVLDAG